MGTTSRDAGTETRGPATRKRRILRSPMAHSIEPGAVDAAPFVVREATAADLPSLVEFIRAEALEGENRVVDPEVLTRAVSSALGNPSLARYWVVVGRSDGLVLGAVATTTEWSDWRNAHY